MGLVFRWVINLSTKGKMTKHFRKARDKSLQYFEVESGSDLIHDITHVRVILNQPHEL